MQGQSVSFTGTQSTVLSEVPASGVALDGSGNLFISDLSGRVLKVAASDGAQTTVVDGLFGPFGLTVDAAGNVIIADTYNSRVLEVAAGTGSQITIASGLNKPQGVAVDRTGNLFYAMYGGPVVKIASAGGSSSEVGSGLAHPEGLAVDAAGDLFITDASNNIVVKVPADGSAQTTIASGLNQPYGVAVDSAGNVFIADYSRIVKVPAGGGSQITLAGGLNRPIGLAVDATGNVFIADTGNHRLLKLQTSDSANFGNVSVGSSTTLTLNYSITAGGTLGTPKVLTQGAPNLDFTLSSSTCTGDVTAGSACTVNVAFAPRAPGVRMGAVQLTDASGNVLATTMIYGRGQGPAVALGPGVQSTLGSGLSRVGGLAVDAAGNVFIADNGNNRVLKIPASGGAQTTVGSGLLYPMGLAADGAGNLFIADSGNNRVVKVSSTGAQSTVGSGLNLPEGVAVDGAGNVFIADYFNGRVVKVPADGGLQTTVLGGLNLPRSVAIDGAGNIFITDTFNNRVVKIPAGGGPETTVGSNFSYPSYVSVDAAGNLFVVDGGTNRVLKVAVNGGQTTVVDGLNSPAAAVVDGTGNIFVADSYNHRVLKLQRSQPPTLSFQETPVNGTSSDSPQSIEIENIGNATLAAIAPGLVVGANFVQGPGSGTLPDCAADFLLAPGAGCNLSISFMPQSAGDLESAAVLTDNSLNGNPAMQSIVLKGTGTALTQTITFDAIPNQVQGTPLALSASASSGLSVTFTSLTTSVCTVSGETATLTAAGTCTIQASQTGNDVYAAAAPVSQSFNVAPAANFTVTPIPQSETVRRGVLAGFILQLKSVNGFNGVVRLSCSGGPTGSYCLEFPQTVHVHGTAFSVAGILFPRKTKPGTYLITFTGVSGALTNSTTAKFIVK